MQRRWKQNHLPLQWWEEQLQLRGEMLVVYVTYPSFQAFNNTSNSNRVPGMPDKSALEEASRLFKLGGTRVEEL